MSDRAPTHVSNPIRAAKDVCMSAEHQRYSIENQAEIICRYAESRGIDLARTYEDDDKTTLASE